MNKNWVKRQRAEQRELEQLRKKNRESVKEIQRLHQKVRNVREASEKALEDVTSMCEMLIVAAMDGKETITIDPYTAQASGKTLFLQVQNDGRIVCRLIAVGEADEEAGADA